MVAFKEVRQRFALLKGDQRQQHVPGERQIEGGVGFAMTVAVFLPGTGVALVVVAGFHRPVPAHRLGRALLLAHGEAGEEVAGVAFLRLERVVLLRPIALDGEGRAGPRQSDVDGRDRGDGTAAPVQPPVFAFLAQFKKGVPLRACAAPARRLAVFSLVPMR
jgi:hypothetical protein